MTECHQCPLCTFRSLVSWIWGVSPHSELNRDHSHSDRTHLFHGWSLTPYVLHQIFFQVSHPVVSHHTIRVINLFVLLLGSMNKRSCISHGGLRKWLAGLNKWCWLLTVRKQYFCSTRTNTIISHKWHAPWVTWRHIVLRGQSESRRARRTEARVGTRVFHKSPIEFWQ